MKYSILIVFMLSALMAVAKGQQKTITEGDQTFLAPIAAQQRQPLFQNYKVKRNDSLYFIAQRYGIEVEDILKYNPDARHGLEKGQILRIPDKTDLARIKAREDSLAKDKAQEEIRKEQTLPPTPGATPVLRAEDVNRGEHVLECHPDVFSKQRRYNVGLLLPLYLPANDTINRVRVTIQEMMMDSVLMSRFAGDARLPVDSFRQRTSPIIYPPSENYVHFYEGALLAVDSLQKAGMHVQFHVFDTNQSRYTIDSLLMSGSLDGLDLIIGPVFPEEQSAVAEFAFRNHIPMISPLSSAGNFEERNPFYYKVNPTKEYLIRKTADYVCDKFSNKNVIILSMGNYEHLPEAEFVRLCREKLLFRGYHDQLEGTHFHEYDFQAEGVGGLAAILAEDRENVIIIPSQTEAQISVAITNLNTLAEKYNIVLVGLSNLQRYKSIQPEYFHRTNMNFLNPYFVDYQSPSVVRFISKFRQNFAAEPSQFSFQGYDVAFYFLSALFNYGKDFAGCLPSLKVSLTQCDLEFGRVTHDGGFMNKGLFITEYTPGYDIRMKGTIGEVPVPKVAP